MAGIAARQKGVVARRQLVAIGVPASTIEGWVGGGRLHVVFTGVYLVGHPLRVPFARELAAVLALGNGAVLSHRSAIELWHMSKPRAGFHPQVTLPRRVRGVRGIRAHFTSSLPPDDTTEKDGIPVTSPLRTLFDFAAQASEREVGRIYEEGLILKLYDRSSLTACSERRAGTPGAGKVRALIERDAPPSITIEEAHRRLLELIRTSDLPHPRTEVQIGPYRVDMYWPAARLIVEMDGGAFHNIPSRNEADKRRDGELAAIGYQVLRVTWLELITRPSRVLTRIERTLALRTPPA